jgi:hypothetical protein
MPIFTVFCADAADGSAQRAASSAAVRYRFMASSWELRPARACGRPSCADCAPTGWSGADMVVMCARPGREASHERVGADRQDEQHDQERIHLRHVEQRIRLDDEVAQPLVRQLRLGEQRADDRDAEAQPYAVDDRQAHRRQVDLGAHLPGEARKLVPTRISTRSICAHARPRADRDREEARQRAHRDLRSRADAEPHDHDREEDDLRRRPEVVDEALVGARQEAIAPSTMPTPQPAMPPIAARRRSPRA